MKTEARRAGRPAHDGPPQTDFPSVADRM